MSSKNSRFFLAMILFIAGSGIQDLYAQAIEINAFYGWQLNGKAKLYNGEFIMQDAPNYGGKLGIGLSTTTFVEISYMRSDSEGNLKPYNISEEIGETIRYSSNYFSVAGLQELNLGKLNLLESLAWELLPGPRKTILATSGNSSSTWVQGLKSG